MKLKNIHSHKGEVTTIIIIVLALALLTTLGWLFYQNFAQKEAVKTDVGTVAVNKDKKDEVSATVTSCMYYEQLCLTHPEGWKYTPRHEEKRYVSDGPLIQQDSDSLVSPDGELTIYLTNGIGQLGGGPCQSDGRKVLIDAAKETDISMTGHKHYNAEYNASKVYAAKLIVPNLGEEGKGYTPYVALTVQRGIDSTGEYDMCYLSYYFQVIQGKTNQESYGSIAVLTTGRFAGKSGDFTKPATMSFDEAKQALSTKTYEEAYSILQTAHYK